MNICRKYIRRDTRFPYSSFVYLSVTTSKFVKNSVYMSFMGNWFTSRKKPFDFITDRTAYKERCALWNRRTKIVKEIFSTER